MNTPAPASTPATAETVAVSLAVLHAHLVRLHADAEAARLPQGVVMGLHWLCEDAASTLAHLHGMTAAKP
jgi:hypothetical protein